MQNIGVTKLEQDIGPWHYAQELPNFVVFSEKFYGIIDIHYGLESKTTLVLKGHSANMNNNDQNNFNKFPTQPYGEFWRNSSVDKTDFVKKQLYLWQVYSYTTV